MTKEKDTKNKDDGGKGKDAGKETNKALENNILEVPKTDLKPAKK